MITQHQQQQQHSNKSWNDMPYAALQLIALYNSDSVNNILDIRLVCQRWHDAAVNYLPADVWRRFHDHLVKVHYQIPGKQIAEAKLPTPDTLQAYSDVARHWQPFIDDARALRETFRGVEKMPSSWKMQALGTVAGWKGVTVESDRVTGVVLCWISLGGSVDLTTLPAGLRVLRLDRNELSGSVDFTRLPSGLEFLDLSDNQSSGSIDLTRLPAELQSLGANKFSSSADLTHLPASLLYLSLNFNQFSGSVDLTQLPASLQKLRLENNQFSGSVDVAQLPASLEYLYLNDNQFSGSIDLTHLPEHMEVLDLRNNKLAGSTSVKNKKCRVEVDGTVKIRKYNDNKFEGSTSVNTKECEVKVDDTVEIKK